MGPKEELEALLARGIDLSVEPQGPAGDRPVRQSAVLILFGQLDPIEAEPLSTKVITLPDPDNPPPALTVPADLDVLLLQRAARMRHHPGQIAFPGGGLEPQDDGPIDAALREAEEETGLDPSGVEVLGTLPKVPIPVSNNLVTPVVGWWSRPSEIAAVDKTEAASVFRVPVAEMLDPLARATGVVRRGDVTHRSHAFELSPRLGGHIVWGFTGILLATLYDELGWTIPWNPRRELEIPISQVG
ncbi:CoA pyrophosphatase [Leucobacter sp. UCMA 4100]|uniref:NUDIX hydrolase n=1 Tax=Leucobacter sp. UCMA 4100 TaxID=2810534 RepID=UPI0022EA8489|nr:CoA pyrophosphatase [Leucobacter sp. UCMA 4100]MDA3147660.1 CoA pyrophosphatase [Leucobacter sp. UCMA 4100]